MSFLRPQALGYDVPGPAQSRYSSPQSPVFRLKLALRDVGPDGAVLQGQCVCGGDQGGRGSGPPGGKVSILDCGLDRTMLDGVDDDGDHV